MPLQFLQLWRGLAFVGCLAFLNVATSPTRAQTNPSTPEPTFGWVSASAVTNRAPWQERLTLGPGDELYIAVVGGSAPPANVTIGPDGRINYLQLRDYQVAGLTIDELRVKLDEALAQFYLAPRTMVLPVNYRSKKYYILGKGSGRGVFVLDRPRTLIEAIAQAGGLALGNFDGATVELADLQRSFFVRNGKRLPINFESLFLQGDLSQNVLMEPEDYVYVASADANEIYVVGSVLSPGMMAFAPDASVVSVIASRGGFAEGAYRQRVLVVRGALTKPTTFIVNVSDVLKAREVDFRLQAGDIVYVSPRPWYKAEQILELAMDSFVYGAVYTYARKQVVPLVD